jgi:hypothetical protein
VNQPYYCCEEPLPTDDSPTRPRPPAPPVAVGSRHAAAARRHRVRAHGIAPAPVPPMGVVVVAWSPLLDPCGAGRRGCEREGSSEDDGRRRASPAASAASSASAGWGAKTQHRTGGCCSPAVRPPLFGAWRPVTRTLLAPHRPRRARAHLRDELGDVERQRLEHARLPRHHRPPLVVVDESAGWTRSGRGAGGAARAVCG